MFWTLFWGLSVVDKIIPDVQHLWVGKDFFALFVKFFASLGLKDPLFPTVALAEVSGLEALNFTITPSRCGRCGAGGVHKEWFFRAFSPRWACFLCFPSPTRCLGTVSGCWSMGCFGSSCFVRGSCLSFSPRCRAHRRARLHRGAGSGLALTLAATWSIRDFSASTFDAGSQPVKGEGRGGRVEV